MANPDLIKNFKAEAAITKYTIVKMGSADGQVLQAAAVGDKIVGVTTDIDAAINERCDVIFGGEAEVVFGGAVTRGDLLTTDANGRAVTAAPAAGTNNRIVGIALVSGVLGDVGRILVQPGSFQG